MTAISVQKWDAEKNYPENDSLKLTDEQRRSLKRLVMAAIRGHTPKVSLVKLYDLEYKLN